MVLFTSLFLASYYFFNGVLIVLLSFLCLWAFMFLLMPAVFCFSFLLDVDFNSFYAQFCTTFSSHAQFLEFGLLILWWPFFFIFLLPILSAHTGGLHTPIFCIEPGQVGHIDPLRSG